MALIAIAEAREQVPGIILPSPEAGIDDMALADYLHQVIAHCRRLERSALNEGARSFSFEIKPDGVAVARCYLKVTVGGLAE